MNAITQLCLLIDKWKERAKNSLSVTGHKIATEAAEDFESLKDLVKKDTK